MVHQLLVSVVVLLSVVDLDQADQDQTQVFSFRQAAVALLLLSVVQVVVADSIWLVIQPHLDLDQAAVEVVVIRLPIHGADRAVVRALIST